MNSNTQFCSMKNQTQQKTNTVLGISLLLLVGVITLNLFLLKYFNVFRLDLEFVLAPFVVIILLTQGDKLLIFLFLSLISFASKLISKMSGNTQSQQYQLTPKQS